jgi:hypothetical protein
VTASDSPTPQELKSHPTGWFAASARTVSAWCDTHPFLFFTLLSGWYIALVWKMATRPLWFDELTTLYIAQQPTVGRMMEAIRTIDLNPPLNYYLTRWSIACFSATPWATRLPALLAFWGGSAAIFGLLRRRASSLVAAVGVLLFWSSPYFSYAAEARPYGLLLGLSAVLLWAWDPPVGSRPHPPVAWVAIVGALLLLSHVFGLLSLGAVWIGEAVRSRRRGRVDWTMVVALLLPLLGALTYGAMFRTLEGSVFAPDAQVTWGKLAFLYYAVFRWMWRPLLVIAVFMFLAQRRRRRARLAQRGVQFARVIPASPDEHTYSRYAPDISAALAALFVVPVVLTLVFLRSHGAFYDRYGMAIVIPIVLVAPVLLQWFLRADARIALMAFGWISVLLLLSTTLRSPIVHATSAVLPARAAAKVDGLLMTSPHGPFRPWWKKLAVPPQLLAERERAPLLTSLDGFHSNLPLVAASELTFVEMDHRESAQLTARLVYLYDRQAEIEISHRAVTDTIFKLKDFFPLRASLQPYKVFVDEHRQFLVAGLYEHPGDWLLRKLVVDGATLAIVARDEKYDDSDIYLVSFPTAVK